MEKEALIRELIEGGYLRTRCILDAFQTIDRRDFVAKGCEKEAYANYPLPIGHGQTISQPLTVAFMLELLQPDAGQRILDVGAGSGWQTTLLAHIVGKARIHADDTRINAEASQQKSASSQRKSAGRVVAIERIPQLTETAKRNIGKYSFIEKGIASVLCADGSKGYAAEAPYDRIIASASGREIPQAWKDQLAIGGRIVAPVENSIILIEKVSKDEFKEQEYFGFSFVPLVEGDRG